MPPPSHKNLERSQPHSGISYFFVRMYGMSVCTILTAYREIKERDTGLKERSTERERTQRDTSDTQRQKREQTGSTHGDKKRHF